MKKYIKSTYIICFLIVLISILCSTFYLFYNTKLTDTKQSLKMTGDAIKTIGIPHNISLEEYVTELEQISKDLRVTFINQNGKVLGDSQIPANNIENHLDRQEVSSAIKTGVGDAVRVSETTGVKTIYVATKINETLILRLSYPLTVAYDFLKTIGLIIVLISIIVFIIINKFANNISDRLLAPLIGINKLLENNAKINIDDRGRIKSFKEVEPILNNIDYLIKKLNYDFTQMQKTEQMRTDFVANVSHELKSPLTSIKGFADLISSGLITKKEQQADYLKRIVKESDRLLDIINDILYLSEIESTNAENLELETIHLDEIAKDVIKSLEGLRAEKRITLYSQGQGNILAVKKDIWELIYNLVDNAIKYGEQRGFIKVEIHSTHNKVILTVKDNGIGIEEEHLARVFERFYRVDTSRSRKSGGTGLGLSIVRNIASKYNGKISIESMRDIGTSIKIEFPLNNMG